MTMTNGTYQWVSIPKTGTRSVTRVLRSMGWRSLGDHVVYGATEGGRCVAAIRDPFDRLASACAFAGIADLITLARTMCHVDAGHGRFPVNRFFAPQVDFLGPDPMLYPFERLTDMIGALGYAGPIPRENRKRKRLTAQQLSASDLAPMIRDRFADDFKLRETLCTP